MYKKQMTLQRVTSYLVLVASALVFIYSLGLMTDLYDVLYLYTDKYYYVQGAEIYLNMQPFNRSLTSWGIVLILSAVSFFVFNTHSRRKYYIANYITIGVNAVLNIGVSIWALAKVFSYKADFLKIDFAHLKEMSETYSTYYSESTFWFDLSAYVFGFLLLVTVISVFNLLMKLTVMNAERRALKISARR
jgi:hypothetical protein